MIGPVKIPKKEKSEEEKIMLEKVKQTILKYKFYIHFFQMRKLNITLNKTPKTNNIKKGGFNASINSINYEDIIYLSHELFHMSSSKFGNGDATGITEYNHHNKKINVGLDEGITDMFANLADENANCAYPFEKLIATILSKLFGFNIFEGYFKNSPEIFFNSLGNDARFDLESLANNLDLYYEQTDRKYKSFNIEPDNLILETVLDTLDDLYSISEYANINKKDLTNLILSEAKKIIPPKIKKMIKFDEINFEDFENNLSL